MAFSLCPIFFSLHVYLKLKVFPPLDSFIFFFEFHSSIKAIPPTAWWHSLWVCSNAGTWFLESHPASVGTPPYASDTFLQWSLLPRELLSCSLIGSSHHQSSYALWCLQTLDRTSSSLCFGSTCLAPSMYLFPPFILLVAKMTIFTIKFIFKNIKVEKEDYFHWSYLLEPLMPNMQRHVCSVFTFEKNKVTYFVEFVFCFFSYTFHLMLYCEHLSRSLVLEMYIYKKCKTYNAVVTPKIPPLNFNTISVRDVCLIQYLDGTWLPPSAMHLLLIIWMVSSFL